MGESARRSWGIVHRLAAVAVLAAVMSPAVTNHDSFPLSTYPMYAFRRGRLDTFQVVLGVDATGADHPLSLRVVANTDDPLIGESLVAQSIRAGRADRLCEQVALRVDAATAKVLVAEEVHDVIARARHKPSLTKRTVYAECAVTR
ncbi:MAG: hypothetical protein ABJD24_14770 [Acidimicrobiales bacterium]